MPFRHELLVTWLILIMAAVVPISFGTMAIVLPAANAKGLSMLIDDFTDTELTSKIGTSWRSVSDRVMGGVSEARVWRQVDEDQPSLALGGDVRLENNGGFIQASLDLAVTGTLDASQYLGLRLMVRGNGETYSVHLRTPDAVRPWQSYRAHFIADAEWRSIQIPFAEFSPHRLEPPLDPSRLKRIGIVAIGRAFNADLKVSRLEFYR